MVVSRLGEREGTECPFGAMEKFWGWTVVTVTQQCDVLNATELCA